MIDCPDIASEGIHIFWMNGQINIEGFCHMMRQNGSRYVCNLRESLIIIM